MTTNTTAIDSDDYDAGTLRLLCAEQIIATLSVLCLNQAGNNVQINADMLGEGLHGIELLLQDSRKLLNKITDMKEVAA